MAVVDREKLHEEIAAWAKRHGGDRGALMPVLQELQKKYCMISDPAMQCIADVLGIHPVEVYGVVSFYSFLDHKPKGKYIIRLCQTITCDMQGKAAVAEALEGALGIRFGETTEDGLFTLEYANCLGMCDQGPAMLVNDEIFAKVSPDKVSEIVDSFRQAASKAAATV